MVQYNLKGDPVNDVQHIVIEKFFELPASGTNQDSGNLESISVLFYNETTLHSNELISDPKRLHCAASSFSWQAACFPACN